MKYILEYIFKIWVLVCLKNAGFNFDYIT